MSEGPREDPPPLGRLSAPVTRLSRRSLDTGSSSKDLHLERQSIASELTRESLTAYLEKRSPALERSSVTRANQEMSNRSDFPVRCSLSVSIREVEHGDGVYYKFDGQRFAYSDATVKVQARSTYQLTLVAKPHMDIAPNVLHIRAVGADAVPRQNVVFLSKRRSEGNGFEGNWKCDLNPNGKSQRVELTLSGQFKHFGNFSLPLLLKVYDTSQKGANQGFKLKWVVFELSRKNTGDGLVQLDSVRRPKRRQLGQGAVVIDNGSWECRGGYAEEKEPCLRFPNALIRPRARWSTEYETVVGESQFNVKGFDFGRAAPRSAFDGNVVVNFDTQEAILDYAFDRLGFTSTVDFALS